MKMKLKIEIWILAILLIPISLALTGTRSLTPDIGYMCEDGKYQIVMNPTSGYSMEEILSQNWHFSSLEGNAIDDCTIQTDDTKVRCGGPGISGTRTLIFNVLNAPGTYDNVFSNNPDLDKANGLNANLIVKAKICQPDNDIDGYSGSSQTNICGCNTPAIDCCDSGNEASLGCSVDTDSSIYPGAVDIPGDGIDQDCDGEDTLLPSSILRTLPSSVQQGVQFEVKLDIKHTGEEPNLVIDERFNANDFNCGSAPINKGVCSAGKVRWVITTPISKQLKYYLVPKTTKTCYDFSSGKYLFEERTENSMSGDYVINTGGDMSCVSCTPTGAEVCGNSIDEDCDGYICSGEECSTIEGSAAGNCDDGIDNDCDTEKDWDTWSYRGPEKGDNGCAVGVTAVSVSNPSPYPNMNIDVYCTTTVGSINSVQAFIGTQECSGDTPGSVWNGNIFTFKDCNVGVYAAQKTVKCTINPSKSYQSGTDQTMNINLTPCDCSGSICNPTILGKRCNGCYYIDVSGTENEAALNCADNADNDCDNKCDHAGCTGYPTGDDGCPVDVE